VIQNVASFGEKTSLSSNTVIRGWAGAERDSRDLVEAGMLPYHHLAGVEVEFFEDLKRRKT